MKLNKLILRYINLVNYREKFVDGSDPHKNATTEMETLEKIIRRELSKEDKLCITPE